MGAGGKGYSERCCQGTGEGHRTPMGPALGRVLGQQCSACQKNLLCVAAGVLPCKGPKALNKNAPQLSLAGSNPAPPAFRLHSPYHCATATVLLLLVYYVNAARVQRVAGKAAVTGNRQFNGKCGKMRTNLPPPHCGPSIIPHQMPTCRFPLESCCSRSLFATAHSQCFSSYWEILCETPCST